MHSDRPYFSGKPMPPFADRLGYYMQNAPVASVFNGMIVPPRVKHFMCPSSNNIHIQPSDACPRNFIIFDQTKSRSQIMFHPEISSRLISSGIGIVDTSDNDNIDQIDANDERKVSSPFKEDSDDIDALLCTGDDGDCDDDEVSTARTDAVYECNSPDSCSSYESSSRKRRASASNSSGSEDKKRQRMGKLVKALRGIVPGSNRMSTEAVLDEAVRYLKSLRVEMQKIGIGNSKG